MIIGFEFGGGFFLGRLVWFFWNHNCSGLPKVCKSRLSESSYAYMTLMKANKPEIAV